jgi:hypothetical protein
VTFVLCSIANILQTEIFEHFGEPDRLEAEQRYPELAMTTTLPHQLGGPLQFIPRDLLDRETWDDPELRSMIMAGVVPTVDTILRCGFCNTCFHGRTGY